MSENDLVMFGAGVAVGLASLTVAVWIAIICIRLKDIDDYLHDEERTVSSSDDHDLSVDKAKERSGTVGAAGVAIVVPSTVAVEAGSDDDDNEENNDDADRDSEGKCNERTRDNSRRSLGTAGADRGEENRASEAV